MSPAPEILVVGGESLIGRAIGRRLDAGGVPRAATSRRQGQGGGGNLFLDLAADPLDWPPLPPVQGAVLCAAVARIGDCEADPAASALVNVKGTTALAARLVEQGAYVLLLSSDKVFDGSTPRRRRTDPPCPRTAYGAQKAAAEAAVLGLHGATGVLRLSKVLSPALSLLTDWRMALERGDSITPYLDLTLAPVSDDFVADLAVRLLRDRRPGLFQASGDSDLSYADLAHAVAGALASPAALVRPTRSDRRAIPRAARAPHTTLDMSLEEELYGLRQPLSRAVCAQVAAGILQ